ncbi:MAG: FtsX-like permease family protein [Bacteroidales bacterium]|nr:FtsX-like permease family protein [Bacteroidales bacterium]
MIPSGTLFNLKITGRILSKGKTYTLINLTGLVMGLTAAFILVVFAINELSYNRSFHNSNQMYRVIVHDSHGIKSGITPFLLKDFFQTTFPEIKQTSRIIRSDYFTSNIKVKKGPILVSVTDFYCVDPAFIDIFSLAVTPERNTRMLDSSNSILISEHFCKRIFGKKDPTGKLLECKIDGQVYQMMVQGVFKDFTWNSSFKPEILATIALYKERLSVLIQDSEKELSSGKDYSSGLFLLVNKNVEIASLTKRLPIALKKSIFRKNGLDVSLQKFTNSYFDSGDVQNDYIIKGNKTDLLIYISLAVFILMLAGINYSMLNTARSALRFKEIGIRKVLGASKVNLRSQIITESFALTLLALPLTFLVLGLINPVLSTFYGAEIQIHFNTLWISVVLFTIIILLIAFLSGFYIALYLSSLNLLTALKSNYYLYKKMTLGKFLIVFQLFITISLFIGLIVILLQLNFLYNRNMGIQKENLMIVNLQPEEFVQSNVLEKQLSDCPEILNSSQVSIAIPTFDKTSNDIKVQGQEEKVPFEIFKATPTFCKTMGIEIVRGRNFQLADTNAQVPPIIINEEAAQTLQFRDPLNKKIGPYIIIGVTKNFSIRTMHLKVSPTIVVFDKEPGQTMIIRYKAGREQQLLKAVRNKWSLLAPNLPLEYKFFDKELNQLYGKEKKFGFTIGLFTGIAFSVTGMGLFGLAMLMAERRRKEISVRKIFGATRSHIILILQKEFLIDFLIAAALSVPVSWYCSSLWLNGFYYHISLNWWIFLGAILTVGFFVSLILFWKSRRVLNENPSNTLKYE